MKLFGRDKEKSSDDEVTLGFADERNEKKNESEESLVGEVNLSSSSESSGEDSSSSENNLKNEVSKMASSKTKTSYGSSTSNTSTNSSGKDIDLKDIYNQNQKIIGLLKKLDK